MKKSCLSKISFPSLASSYSAVVGSTAPSINTFTSSSTSGCVVDAGSYTLSSSVGDISMASNGQITVSTTSVIATTSLTVSVRTNGGAETQTSPLFTVEVIPNIDVKLLTLPKGRYDLEIGEITTLDLGKFQGNDIDLIFVNYKI